MGAMGDFTYAIRSLRRAPVFTLAAVATLALGVGVNSAFFSVIHAVLLDPLPYRDPERLVHVAETHPEFPSFQVSAPDFFDWQQQAHSFEGLAAYTFQEMNKWVILGDGPPEPVQTVQASATLFPLLGVRPLEGRAYTVAEESGKAPVVVISESLWRRKYRSDPQIVGRKIRLVDWSVTVVGVVSQRQAMPHWGEVWMPLTYLDPALVKTRRFHPLEVVGRLKAGIPEPEARAEMQGIAARLTGAYPETNGKIGATVLPLSAWITGGVRPTLLIVWGAVSLLMLLACANIAHLVLIRTVHRSREMAVRAALGGSAARLAKLLLVENLLVAAAGGLAGALLARFSEPLLARLSIVDLPRLDSFQVSPAAVWFGAGLTLLSAILFAIPAILHLRTSDLQAAIQQSRGLSLSHRRSWFGDGMIAAEVALAFVVLTGAGLLYRSLALLLSEPAGFDGHNVIAAEIPLALDWNRSAEKFEHQVAPRLRAIPGVSMVAAANCAPMMLHSTELSRFATRFAIPGRPLEAGSFPVAQQRWVTPDYFHLLQIPLRSGRLLTQADATKPAFVVNETLARLYFQGGDPVGRELLIDVLSPAPQPVPIVGVVADVRDLGFEVEPRPTLYSVAVSNRMTVLLRVEGNPASLLPMVRAALTAADPEAPIGTLAPLDEIVRQSTARRRFALQLLGIFAVLAALLTAVGVYGVISYSLSRRTGEFAIRFALGARPGHVRALVLRQYAAPTIVGLLAGGWLAWLFASASQALLYKLSPADPAVLAASAAGLALLVALSALRPTAKASSISPAALPRE
jgi:predicted permease